MKKQKRLAFVFALVLPAAVLLTLPSVVLAGAPVLSGVNPALSPAIAKGATAPPGYLVSSFLGPIVTNGTLLDDFEGNTAINKWGGNWFTVSDNPAGGLSTINPPYLTFFATAPGYNSAYCAKMNVTLNGKANLGYNPYGILTTNLNPASTTTVTVAVDLTKATGFRYWFKGGKHYFKLETSDLTAKLGAQSYYQDSVAASTTWRQVSFTWDSLHTVTYATGAITAVTPASKKLATRLSWVMQGPDGTVDSLFIDNVEVTGFADSGIAVTGASNTNGAWQYSTNAGTSWNVFGTLSDAGATLLNAAAQVRFVPTASYTGPATFIFRAWNQTDGNTNGATGVAVVPNGGITAYSSVAATATVQVQDASGPVIQTQPKSITVNESAACTLSVVATNATSYQWKKAGTAIAGATGSSYIKSPVATTDAGTYTVMVRNAADSVESQQATVTVIAKPANATLTPAKDTVLLGGAVTFTVNATVGTAPFTYQWRQSGVTIGGQTGKTYSIASARVIDSGSYTAVVINPAGSATSNAAVLVVIVPIKAAFKMSDSIVQSSVPVQFTDSLSTGPFTRWIWNFGDGAVDTVNPNPSHQFASGIYQVKLVLFNGAVRADSAVKSLTVYNDNPIAISGKYVSAGKAQVTFVNYQALPTNIFSTYADSVKLWYKSGAIPTSITGATWITTYGLADMLKATAPFQAQVSVTLAGTDTAVGFMTQVHWNKGGTASWSAFAPGNGAYVIMTDTTTPGNPATIVGTFLSGDSVMFSVYGHGADTSSVDTFGIWYGTSTTDNVANFTTSPNIFWFNVKKTFPTMAAANGRDSIIVANPLFNTGVQKTLYCAVILKGKNGKLSLPYTSSYPSGVNRPTNPILLKATAVSATQIRLSWNVVGGISNIRFWYNTSAAIPTGTADFTSPPYDVISAASVSDTVLVVPGLQYSTHYYFGGQVYSNGYWSYVTDLASANATTLNPSGKLDTNSVKILGLAFDSVKNEIHVKWRLKARPLDTLQVGISYSLSGYPTADTSVHQNQLVTSAADTVDSATVKLREPLVFSASAASPTNYYVALWEGRVNGLYASPTDSSSGTIASPTYNWQHITFFTKVPGDTSSVFNGNILLITTVATAADVANDTGTIQYYNALTPPNLAGFVQVSVPFYFSGKDQSGKFKIALKLSALPTGAIPANVRIYQLINGLWYVDRTSTADNTYAYTTTADNCPQCQYPLVALVDTQDVSLTRGFHADTLAPLTDVFDTLFINDNCANVTWKYYYTMGGAGYDQGTVDSGTLSATSASIYEVIPGGNVTADNGLRAMVVVSDGVHTDTQNVSRQVLRTSSDFVPTEPGLWDVLRATAILNKPDIKTILTASAGTTPWTYDRKQMRLFRWYPYPGNQGAKSNWVEYSDTTATMFNMAPGVLVWAKSRAVTNIDFGAGVTPSLKQSYPLPLSPANWTDLALPFRFDIRIGDIIDSTGSVSDSLLFYSWAFDQARGRYVSSPIYMKAFAGFGLADMGTMGTIISSKDLVGGCTVYNPAPVTVSMRVPPIPKTMSGYALAKKAVAKRSTASGWAISVNTNLTDGSRLSPVFCGYSPAKTTATTFFPLPPSFADEYVGVLDDATNGMHGHALSHAVADGGCTFVLAFVNGGSAAAAFSYRLGNCASLPQGVLARSYNRKTGAGDDFTSGSATVTVAGGGTEYRVLAIGSTAFLAKMAVTLKSGILALGGVYPNPFASLVHIRYNVPNAGVSYVRFSIYDLRGRMVWQRTVDQRGARGAQEIAWDGMSGQKRRVAAGAYLVRMVALDENNRQAATFEKRMTYVP